VGKPYRVESGIINERITMEGAAEAFRIWSKKSGVRDIETAFLAGWAAAENKRRVGASTNSESDAITTCFLCGGKAVSGLCRNHVKEIVNG
jgi:hypothetical protein